MSFAVALLQEPELLILDDEIPTKREVGLYLLVV